VRWAFRATRDKQPGSNAPLAESKSGSTPHFGAVWGRIGRELQRKPPNQGPRPKNWSVEPLLLRAPAALSPACLYEGVELAGQVSKTGHPCPSRAPAVAPLALARPVHLSWKMYHYVARTRQGLLFHSPAQARRLWQTLALPGLSALCLMPNHLHLQHPRRLAGLSQTLAGYSRWLNYQRGHHGSLLAPLPPPTWAEGEQKVRRDARYIHLNPCRAGLVRDPLAWPWSTYRDRIGLSLQPAVRRSWDPERLHGYVSADPSVHVQGTPLPRAGGVVDRWALQAAVSELMRVPLTALSQRGDARRLWMQAVKELSDVPTAQLAKSLGVARSTLQRLPPPPSERLELILRIAGDPRFPGI
jgi:putative transposase